MKRQCAIVLFVVLGYTWANNSVDVVASHYSFPNCPQLKSQESLDLDGIMGKWYVVEVLDHRTEPARGMSATRVTVDSCPVIKLRSDDRGLLRLLWKEEAGDVEYMFRVSDPVHGPGFWHSASQQNGTLTLKTYAQFAGTVHVMKAVGNHMVLTFCAGQPDDQLYTVLMSREHILQRSNIKGVHNLLARRHLSIGSVRETCAKGGTSTMTPIGLLTIGLCWLVSSRLYIHSSQ
ncbi:uncharacterized protein [Venturia canescens]|uniref:uncharacterized protein n=1 Tax=Venturia canescens TaxID=32260 RepID=UPI001C9C0791|nr:uncharacterized protein LOC122418087 [Venturia canescens]